MRKSMILVGTAALALAACSENGSYDEAIAETEAGDAMSMEAVEGSEAVADADGSAVPQLGDIPITMPKLAYTYDYMWRMPAADIGPLQRRHASLCEQAGPTSCQIPATNQSGAAADEVRGTLQMAVASTQARAFGALRECLTRDSDGAHVSSEITRGGRQ